MKWKYLREFVHKICKKSHIWLHSSMEQGDLVDFNAVGTRDRGLLRNQLHWFRLGMITGITP
jgi:hypothetical protein